jgi:hypothetical protein
VKNPTDKDFILIYENERFIIPSKYKDIGYGPGQRVMQRYLAERYTTKIVDQLIFGEADQKLEATKEKLIKRGATDIEYNANMELMSVKGMRSDNPDVRKPLEDDIWMGIEEEFGVDKDYITPDAPKPMEMVDPFARLKDKRVSEAVKTVSPIQEQPAQLPKQFTNVPKKHDLSEVSK